MPRAIKFPIKIVVKHNTDAHIRRFLWKNKHAKTPDFGLNAFPVSYVRCHPEFPQTDRA